MAVQSVIANSTADHASGTAAFGSLTNRWAVLVDQANSARDLTLTFKASWDAQTFVPVTPAAKRGSIYVFDAPASNITVDFSDNAAGNNVTITAVALTD